MKNGSDTPSKVVNLLGPILIAATLAGIAFVYLISISPYVQGGDTGELVAAAYHKFIAHPPGYPLWLWLQHSFVHLLSMGTVFWRASLFATLCAIASLSLLTLAVRREILVFLITIPILAVQKSFLETSLLPDVFSFHLLLVATIGYFYFFTAKDSNTRAFFISFLLLAALSHHLTIVFLFPILLSLWSERKVRVSVSIGALAGFVFSVAMYGSLLSFQTESPHSWGNLKSVPDIFNHFLRKDYGTIQLAAEGGAPFQALLHFLRTSFLELSPLLLFTFWCASKNREASRDIRVRSWLICIALSIGFFLFANVNPSGMGKEILLRFHAMPVLQMVILCLFVLKNIHLTRRSCFLALGFSIPLFLLLASQSSGVLHHRSDSRLEDYAINILKEVESKKPVVILVENDSAYFALRYVQSTLYPTEQVAIAALPLFFHPWYLQKIQHFVPALELANKESIWRYRILDLSPDLLEQNLPKVNFLLFRSSEPKNAKIQYLGLGKLLSSGAGISFEEPNFTFRSRTDLEWKLPQSQSKWILMSHYANYYLAKGKDAYDRNQPQEAAKAWRGALDLVPFAAPALLNLCGITEGKDSRCTPQAIQKAQRDSYWLQ